MQFLAEFLAQRDLPVADMLDRYELFAYKQWLRVYMRSRMIKDNKVLLESVGDTLALVEKLHIYRTGARRRRSLIFPTRSPPYPGTSARCAPTGS